MLLIPLSLCIFTPTPFIVNPSSRVEVNKFDGSDPTSWVTQMEHYFSLHGITDELAKLHYVVLYLDPECWQWCKWRKHSRQGYIS
jgi:hypothetical protein